MIGRQHQYGIHGPIGFGTDGNGDKVWFHSATEGSRLRWNPAGDGVLDGIGDANIIANWANIRAASNFAPSSTGGIQEAVDDLPSAGGVVYAPAGTHACTSPITVTSKPFVIMGAGPEKTVLKFTGCNGIVADTNADDKAMIVSNLTLATASAGTYTALQLENSYSSGTHRTIVVDNVCIRPWTAATHYWLKGIKLIDAWNASLSRIFIRGKDNTTSMTRGLEIHGVDVHINDVYTFYTDRAVSIDADCEGIRIHNLSAFYTDTGVYWDTGVQLMLSNSYFDCISNGLTLLSVTLDHIIGNSFAKRGTAAGWIGMNLINSGRSSALGNYITGSDGTDTGISVDTFGRWNLLGNVVDACNVGIWLKTGVTYCSVVGNSGEGNTTDIVDDGSNNDIGHNPFG